MTRYTMLLPRMKLWLWVTWKWIFFNLIHNSYFLVIFWCSQASICYYRFSIVHWDGMWQHLLLLPLLNCKPSAHNLGLQGFFSSSNAWSTQTRVTHSAGLRWKAGTQMWKQFQPSLKGAITVIFPFRRQLEENQRSGKFDSSQLAPSVTSHGKNVAD